MNPKHNHQHSSNRTFLIRRVVVSVLQCILYFCLVRFAKPKIALVAALLAGHFFIIIPATSQEAPAVTEPDTVVAAQSEAFALEAQVQYIAEDSIFFDLSLNKVFLYGNADIKYQDIHLTADYIEIDFNNRTLFASGLPDYAGVMQGTPVFIDGEHSYRANTITYNFDTRRGFIRNVITQEGEGFLHATKVKRLENDITNVAFGKYTTCNLEHPHFEFRYRRAKVIPDDKVVTGPVYLVIEDVPLPLFLPFGFFPNRKGQRSGILIPTYGESANRGFYLENGGYYWGINEFMELHLRGDIYSRGSWAIKPTLNYRARYRYSGNFNINYAVNVLGEKGTPDYQRSRDFAIRWVHTQDPKAHPVRRFSANVNIQTSKFNRFNPVTPTNFLSNTFQSSISYQTNFNGKVFLNASATHSQNTLNNMVTFTAPDVSISANRMHPFRRRERVGALRWYENITVGYSASARNEVSTVDSLLFRPETLSRFRNGMRHTIPVSSSIRLFNHINMNNSMNYVERWYSQRIEQRWVGDTVMVNGAPQANFITNDTVSGFFAVRDFDVRTSLTTTLYGLMHFKRGPLRAVRHVMNPSVGFSMRPDFSAPFWGYYGDVQVDTEGNTRRYSFFQHSIYGTPPIGRSGNLNMSLSNNLEIKVRSRQDTITGERKIALIDNLTVSTSYDMARDSLRWSTVNVSARTTLFKNLQIQFSGRWSPYALDQTGRPINRFVWEVDRRLLRRENTSWNFSFRYSINSTTFGRRQQQPSAPVPLQTEWGTEAEQQEVMMFPEQFIDWNQPWNLNLDYSLRITNQFSPAAQKFESNTIQALSFNGDISITPKWKIAFQSGFDFVNQDFTYTSFSFYRDLHCWEMRFNWIPMGGMKSWNFQINVKSPMLQDLKLTRRKDFRDF